MITREANNSLHTGHPDARRLSPARWMSALPDDLLLSEINIPGSHNAAAIDTIRRTRWACQHHSITTQLGKGIRLLDIRLKPKRSRREASPNVYEYVTCHGHLGLFGANEFQPFDQVLEECMGFLKANPTETIIITLQIDDWRETRPLNRPHVLASLQARLSGLPRIIGPHIPTLQECRGRFYLINRINDDAALGVPINIPDNTAGAMLKPTAQRYYEVYVQDQYKWLNYRRPEMHKLRLTLAALEHKRPRAVLLNYVSATKPVGRIVYITRELSQHLAAENEATENPHPQKRGWFFFDYATEQQEGTDLRILLIVSNFR